MNLSTRRRARAGLLAAAATALAAVAVGSSAGAEPAGGAEATYVVLYQKSNSTAGAAAAVRNAGGTLVANYPEIGVVIARSSNAGFEAVDRGGARGRERRSPPATSGSRSATCQADAGPLPGDAPAAASDLEPLAAAAVGHASRSTPSPPTTSPAAARRSSSATSTPASISPTPISPPTIDAANSADCSSGTPQPLLRGQRPERPRHPHRRHHRRRRQRHRHRRGRAEREDRRDQVEQRRRVLLPGDGGLLVHVGRRSRHRRDEQQLLRRPVAVQLPQRCRAAGDLEGGAEGDPPRPVQGHGRRRLARATRAPTSPIPRPT